MCGVSSVAFKEIFSRFNRVNRQNPGSDYPDNKSGRNEKPVVSSIIVGAPDRFYSLVVILLQAQNPETRYCKYLLMD